MTNGKLCDVAHALIRLNKAGVEAENDGLDFTNLGWHYNQSSNNQCADQLVQILSIQLFQR